MSDKKNQDETSDFVCESEEAINVDVESQEVDQEEEQASSETDNTEDDASKEAETKVDAEDESTDKESDSSGTDAAAEDDKAKKPNGVQKRIDKVVREREEEKRKNESLESRIKELEGKQQKPEDKAEIKEPVESDFETYDKYLDALDKFDKQDDKAIEKEAEPKSKDKSEAKSNGLTDSQKTAMAIIQESIDSSDNSPDDFEAVALAPDVDITGDMLEALSECDDPTKVMYHLGKNKELATEIAGKSPAQQMRAIIKLDITVTSKPKKQIKLTKAPDAIDPVKGSDSQKKSQSDMSFSEFEAERNATQAKKSHW